MTCPQPSYSHLEGICDRLKDCKGLKCLVYKYRGYASYRRGEHVKAVFRQEKTHLRWTNFITICFPLLVRMVFIVSDCGTNSCFCRVPEQVARVTVICLRLFLCYQQAMRTALEKIVRRGEYGTVGRNRETFKLSANQGL